MSVSDVFLLVVRWVHLIAAAAWIGGSLFYLVVLRPTLHKFPKGSDLASIATASEFRALVDTSIFVLLTTGVILTFNRLSTGIVGMPYVATLGIKIALSVWMFGLARNRRRRRALVNEDNNTATTSTSWLGKISRAVSGYNTIVILGIIVFLLSDLLKVLFELALPNG